MPYSFIKRIGMLTFLLESSVKIFLQAKHSLSNHLSKCFFLLLSSGLFTFSVDCRYHIEPPNWKQTIAKKHIYLSFPSAQTMRCRPPDKPPWLLCDARKDLGNLRPPPQQFAVSNRPVVYERQPVKVATSHLSLMVQLQSVSSTFLKKIIPLLLTTSSLHCLLTLSGEILSC